MPLNKTTKKSLKGLKINKRIKKKNTKKNKLFKKTRGSRNSKVHKKRIHRNRKIKSTKKLTGGGGYEGIRLFINGEELKKKLGVIQPTETVESILKSVGREGEIIELYINRKFIRKDQLELSLGTLGISNGSIIRVKLSKPGESSVNNVPIRRIPDADFESLERLKESNDRAIVNRKFDQKYWDQVKTIIQEQFGGVQIDPASSDTIFVGMGSGRQYMYNKTNIDAIYYKKYSHNNRYAPTNVQQLPPILRDRNKDNLEDLRSYDQRIFVINMDRDINSYNNEPVLLSYLKLKYGDQLFDNFKDIIISEHEAGKRPREDNDILIHTLLDGKIIFISLKCDIELEINNNNHPLKIIGIDPKYLPSHHGYFQT